MKKDVPTMIELEDKVVSLDIIREKFVCDLAKCKGICCVEGESGAPLEEDEVKLLEDEYDKIKPYLREFETYYGFTIRQFKRISLSISSR